MFEQKGRQTLVEDEEGEREKERKKEITYSDGKERPIERQNMKA